MIIKKRLKIFHITMEDLFKYGVAVIPVFNQNDLTLYNNAFWQAVKSFPEYNDLENKIYV